MKFNLFSIIAPLFMIISFISAGNDGSDSEVEEKRLENVFKKMSKSNNGMAINLDSTFGGGRCNCVCKEN